MASAGKSQTVADFVSSLTRSELQSFDGAELFKLIEFSVVHELGLVSAESTATQVREAVIEWCCATLSEWDVLESSPWFYPLDYEGRYVRQHVARLRQRLSKLRREASEAAAREEVQSLSGLTEAELNEFFDE